LLPYEIAIELKPMNPVFFIYAKMAKDETRVRLALEEKLARTPMSMGPGLQPRTAMSLMPGKMARPHQPLQVNALSEDRKVTLTSPQTTEPVLI
jgi:hypothetical protein